MLSWVMDSEPLWDWGTDARLAPLQLCGVERNPHCEVLSKVGNPGRLAALVGTGNLLTAELGRQAKLRGWESSRAEGKCTEAVNRVGVRT